MENENVITPTIECIPNEVILLILQYNNRNEIVSFGMTCKRFYETIKSNQSLWKKEFKKTFSSDMFEVVNEHCNGNWLEELKRICIIKKQVYSELIRMSHQFYWQANDVTLQNIKHFFSIATNNNLSLYYIIYILQDLIKKGNKTVETFVSKKPFTLTEMHYAKVILRHLIHGYLAIKLAKSHLRRELPPEIVVNFFLQWIDHENLHLDENVNNKLQVLVNKVESLLENKDSSKGPFMTIQERCAKGLISQEKVLDAITQVIYRQRHMAVTTTANLQTLDIIKVLENKIGNAIVVGAIYHAVARKCNVKCELVAFPNHLFLEWRPNWDDPNAPAYTIDLNNGELKPKRRCPFSQNNHSNRYEYHPDALLQSIYSSFRMSMGSIEDWNTQNALLLLDLLGINQMEQNAYRSFFIFLFDNMRDLDINTPLNIKYMSDVHLQLLMLLASRSISTEPSLKEIVVKRHDSRVQYAIGMVCYHLKLNYVCIVRGWDPCCRAEWLNRMGMETNLNFGMDQPFYYVVAVDQSIRYVAQENLKDVQRPTRLYHLEDIIAREFTHFDGFAYVPNDEKRYEYPDDEAIASMYRSRAVIYAITF
ncbi:F-box only protein 21-like [Galleria mellonella]|uniref:F-box only protein 21-like n=1 Tax=Galleria mellonella TaxID=7137 RepID=A0A6J1WRC4_GALME|nr:F-box only protein 21-like [Galleria mellonella]